MNSSSEKVGNLPRLRCYGKRRVEKAAQSRQIALLLPPIFIVQSVAPRHERLLGKSSATCRGCVATARDELRKQRNLGRLRYSCRRFSLFRASHRDMNDSSELNGHATRRQR